MDLLDNIQIERGISEAGVAYIKVLYPENTYFDRALSRKLTGATNAEHYGVCSYSQTDTGAPCERFFFGQFNKVFTLEPLNIAMPKDEFIANFRSRVLMVREWVQSLIYNEVLEINIVERPIPTKHERKLKTLKGGA